MTVIVFDEMNGFNEPKSGQRSLNQCNMTLYAVTNEMNYKLREVPLQEAAESVL